MTTISLILMSMMVTMTLILVTKLISLKKESHTNKGSTFECGFIPQSPTQITFSLQFFLIMVLFLIFDMEVALLFPYPMSDSNSTMKVTIILFLLILMIGLLMEWNSKKLNWSN